jgi:hypothetical protein
MRTPKANLFLNSCNAENLRGKFLSFKKAKDLSNHKRTNTVIKATRNSKTITKICISSVNSHRVTYGDYLLCISFVLCTNVNPEIAYLSLTL